MTLWKNSSLINLNVYIFRFWNSDTDIGLKHIYMTTNKSWNPISVIRTELQKFLIIIFDIFIFIFEKILVTSIEFSQKWIPIEFDFTLHSIRSDVEHTWFEIDDFFDGWIILENLKNEIS